MMIRPKAFLLLGSLIAVAMLPPSAQAQQSPPARAQQQPAAPPPALKQAAPEQHGMPVRIAVIDLDTIKGNAAAFKDIRRQVQDLRNTFNAERLKETEALRAAQDEVGRQRAILSADAFAEERRKLDLRAQEADRRLQVRDRQIEVVVNDARAVVEKALLQVIEQLLKDNNISLLFTRQAVYALAQPLDATDEVIVALDKRLTSVKVGNPNTVKIDVPGSPVAAPAAAPAQNPAAAKPAAPAAQAPAKTAPAAPARPAPAR